MTEASLKDQVLKCIYLHEGDDERLYEGLFKIFGEFYNPGIPKSFAEEFREIFPSRKLGTGKNFKSNAKDLEKKLKFFLKNYDYSWSTIMEAAKQYVAHAESVGFEYIRTASYFVYKQGEGSDLADWCERVLEEGSFSDKEPLHRKV